MTSVCVCVGHVQYIGNLWTAPSLANIFVRKWCRKKLRTELLVLLLTVRAQFWNERFVKMAAPIAFESEIERRRERDEKRKAQALVLQKVLHFVVYIIMVFFQNNWFVNMFLFVLFFWEMTLVFIILWYIFSLPMSQSHETLSQIAKYQQRALHRKALWDRKGSKTINPNNFCYCYCRRARCYCSLFDPIRLIGFYLRLVR